MKNQRQNALFFTLFPDVFRGSLFRSFLIFREKSGVFPTIFREFLGGIFCSNLQWLQNYSTRYGRLKSVFYIKSHIKGKIKKNIENAPYDHFLHVAPVRNGENANLAP